MLQNSSSSSLVSEYTPMQRIHEALFSFLKEIPKKEKQPYPPILKKTSYANVESITEPILQDAELHLHTIYSYVFNCTMVCIMHLFLIYLFFVILLMQFIFIKNHIIAW